MRRRGYTMVEVLVSLVLSAIAVGLVGSFAFRQQRFHRDVVLVAERLEHLEQAAALMPIALRSIAPAEGDIPPGGARDTALEFRATIATAVVCDSGHGVLLLAPSRTGLPRLGSQLTRPGRGDTVWALALTDTNETWTPRMIESVVDTNAACLIGSLSPWGPGPKPSLALRVAQPLPAGAGSVARITRAWRYSIYRGSDGFWYLGAKEWNPEARQFNGIQPISGPFLSASKGGVAFRYADSLGRSVSSGAADTRAIAWIEIAFRIDSTLPGKLARAIGIRPGITTSVALRNRVK